MAARLTRTLLRPSSRSSIPHLRSFSTVRPKIKIVEVSPRDGLQNEKSVLSLETKVSLISKLSSKGFRTIEAGSFVSPKWVPQMSSTPDLLKSPTILSLSSSNHSLSLPVLVPNLKGLENFLQVLKEIDSPPDSMKEISVFVAASEAFNKANLNTTIQESMKNLEKVVEQGISKEFRVRGYVSTVIGCPYSGKISPSEVSPIVKDLLQMGCYEVSLGDTIGVGTPLTFEQLLMRLIADGIEPMIVHSTQAHCHDTYSTSISNVLTLVNLGIRTVDSSIGGLGGCPFSPGASGNVATEDVVFALESSSFDTGLLPPPSPGSDPSYILSDPVRLEALEGLAEVGDWILKELGREGAGVGKAVLAGRERRKKQKERESKL